MANNPYELNSRLLMTAEFLTGARITLSYNCFEWPGSLSIVISPQLTSNTDDL